VKLAQELGKRRTYILSALLYAALSIAWGVFGRMGLGVDYLLAALLGVFNSGWSLMGFSMVSDLSDDGRGGLYSSIWVAADKIGFALGGTLLVGALLSVFGFDSIRAMAGAAQGPTAVLGVLVCFSVGPALLCLFASILLGLRGAKSSSKGKRQRSWF
jgi:Na+/melibiose symporter-like transporter